MPRKISFINYKGGVGKTSLVVNIAASLAQAGKRVLLVDLDAQSNSSIWLMRLDRWNPLNTADAGHLYSIFEPGVCRLRDCIEKDVVRGKAPMAMRCALHCLLLLSVVCLLATTWRRVVTEAYCHRVSLCVVVAEAYCHLVSLICIFQAFQY